MRKLVLACGILAGVVSVGMGAMSDEEWDRNYYDCIEVSLGTPLKELTSNRNACQALINHSIEMGWGSLEQCSKDNCSLIGYFYYYAERYREAIPYFEKAIALGDTLAYTILGNSYLQIEDYYNAHKYFKIGCEKVNANQVVACYNLGAAGYAEGQGVRQNRSTAKQYYGKSCDLGDQTGCDNYKLLNNQGVQ